MKENNFICISRFQCSTTGTKAIHHKNRVKIQFIENNTYTYYIFIRIVLGLYLYWWYWCIVVVLVLFKKGQYCSETWEKNKVVNSWSKMSTFPFKLVRELGSFSQFCWFSLVWFVHLWISIICTHIT